MLNYRNQNVEKVFKSWQLGYKFLYNFAECFKNTMVIYRGQMEAKMNLVHSWKKNERSYLKKHKNLVCVQMIWMALTRISQVIIRSLVDIPLSFHFIIIRQTVHFMNKNFKPDVRVYFMSFGDCLMKSVQSIIIFILKGLINIHEEIRQTIK